MKMIPFLLQNETDSPGFHYGGGKVTNAFGIIGAVGKRIKKRALL
jgi:hypothetical protein